MIIETDTPQNILVVEDVQETRDGIEKLLNADGYLVAVARDERDGIQSARHQRPDLILVSLAGLPSEVITAARRIRERAEVGENVPIVVFCIDEIARGSGTGDRSKCRACHPAGQLQSIEEPSRSSAAPDSSCGLAVEGCGPGATSLAKSSSASRSRLPKLPERQCRSFSLCR